MHNPKEIHLHATHRILHYLKANPRKGIFLLKNNIGLIIEAYTDANYAGSVVDRSSTNWLLYVLRWKPSHMEESEKECGSSINCRSRI